MSTVPGEDAADSLHGDGPCSGCGHDPACGRAGTWSVTDGERWWCHADDHSCYAAAPRSKVTMGYATIANTRQVFVPGGDDA